MVDLPVADGAPCKSDFRYFSWMPKKHRKPEARSSSDKWCVYVVQCVDDSLYTGVTKDVKRRCQQHNAGTASRYTRSRRPMNLIYQEVHPSQSSALKREAAIKSMNRSEKLTMIHLSKKKAKEVRQIAHLEDIPNIGPAIASDLRQLGITMPGNLPGRNPYAMYGDLCCLTTKASSALPMRNGVRPTKRVSLSANS